MLAYTGVDFDGVAKAIRFRPAVDGDLRTPFTTGHGWGTIARDHGEVSLSVIDGSLTLRRFETPLRETTGAGSVVCLMNGRQIAAGLESCGDSLVVTFAGLVLGPGDVLSVASSPA